MWSYDIEELFGLLVNDQDAVKWDIYMVWYPVVPMLLLSQPRGVVPHFQNVFSRIPRYDMSSLLLVFWRFSYFVWGWSTWFPDLGSADLTSTISDWTSARDATGWTETRKTGVAFQTGLIVSGFFPGDLCFKRFVHAVQSPCKGLIMSFLDTFFCHNPVLPVTSVAIHWRQRRWSQNFSLLDGNLNGFC